LPWKKSRSKPEGGAEKGGGGKRRGGGIMSSVAAGKRSFVILTTRGGKREKKACGLVPQREVPGRPCPAEGGGTVFISLEEGKRVGQFCGERGKERKKGHPILGLEREAFVTFHLRRSFKRGPPLDSQREKEGGKRGS